MADEKPQGNQLSIELSEEIAEGVYSNLAIITHSTAEFVIDFIKVMPGMPKAKVKSRVVLTPRTCQALFARLARQREQVRSRTWHYKAHRRPTTASNEFWRPHSASIAFRCCNAAARRFTGALTSGAAASGAPPSRVDRPAQPFLSG
jgi:hypothetical protein